MNIREATISDIDGLLPLYEDLQRFHADCKPDLFTKEVNPYGREFIRDSICSISKIVYVAQENDRIIGFCSAVYNRNSFQTKIPDLFIEGLYVLPESRRRGIGTALYDKMREFADRKGCQKIDLSVYGFNEEAIMFYESLGMAEQCRYMEIDL